MWPAVRTVMIWLIVLAVPAQAIAAARMLHCGPGHERQVVQPGERKIEHIKAERSASHHHTPDASGDHGHDTDSVGDRGDSEASSALELAKYKCSACAHCCTGAAILNSSRNIALMKGADSMPASIPAARPGFFTDAPKRPPRPFLA